LGRGGSVTYLIFLSIRERAFVISCSCKFLTLVKFEPIDYHGTLHVNVTPLEATTFCRPDGFEVLTGVTMKNSVLRIPDDRKFLQISIHDRSRHKLHLTPNVVPDLLVSKHVCISTASKTEVSIHEIVQTAKDVVQSSIYLVLLLNRTKRLSFSVYFEYKNVKTFKTLKY
jgi:hypothetical protein